MPDRPLLPLLGSPPAERADAARNRDALLGAARRLVAERDAACVTMEAVAAAAGVGKATLFRRFGSREGLMAALLDSSEAAWQAAVISGPPPLGPGAPPLERLEAFGRSRIETNLQHADLISAAGATGSRSYAAAAFEATHVRHLLTALGTAGDVPLLATALLAPLDPFVLDQQVRREGLSVERVHAAWVDLVRRVVSRRAAPRGGPAPA